LITTESESEIDANFEEAPSIQSAKNEPDSLSSPKMADIYEDPDSS